MRIPFLIVLERLRKVLGHDTDVVTLHRFHEAISYSVTLRTPYRRTLRFKPQHPGELAHDPVNMFSVDCRHAIKLCLSAKQCPYPMITIRGKLSDDVMYTEKQIRIISVTAAAPILPVIASSENGVQVRTRHPEVTADKAYSPSPGNKGVCAIHFFARPYSTASLMSSFSIVFLPGRRWSSLICFMAAASSEAGTTCSPAATAVRLPSWYCLRQRNNWLLHHVAGQLGRPSFPVQSSAEQSRSFPV